ncbi:MAG: 2-iminoacetate synthase ThiH [Veillonella sp.]|uniref:2-iminoacetate synthase ThiH n=1 Tax=Veillonella sp. TaxID=1926307 RepID=UPI0025E84949|nr:2-iminoacetate synthase ThiH [Veillonella sp.]MBS4912910.1 2-iminoacetate synthase ThiH [Veillonella sp.]
MLQATQRKTAPELHGHIATATPADNELLEKDIMTFTSSMDKLDMSRLHYVLDTKNSFVDEAFTADHVKQALQKDELEPEDFMALLSSAAAPFLEDMAQKAKALTRARFGSNIQLFTPLYIANYCHNGCRYCGFNSKQTIKRAQLTADDIKRELEAIAQTGLQEILFLTGESESRSSVEYIASALELAKPYFANIGIEIYPANQADYKILHEAGADFITVFQETYDLTAYEYYHPYGNKRSFPYRFYAQERALNSGFRGAGFAALLGLSNFRYDALATGLHLWSTQKSFPASELSFSVPRLRPVNGELGHFNHLVSDRDLLQIMCAYRLFVPQAQITVSSRESKDFRNAVMNICATKISAGVQVDVGGHSDSNKHRSSDQFDINDTRSVAQMHEDIQKMGLQVVYHDHIRL